MEFSVDLNMLLTVGGWLLAAGVAWGGARAGASTTQKSVEALKGQIESHITDDTEREVDRLKTAILTEQRMSTMETLVGEIHGRVVKARRQNDHLPTTGD